MPKITIRTEGLNELQLKLDRYHGPKLDRALGKATIAAARTLVGPMKAAAPVAKNDHGGKYPHPRGTLRKSIKATRARRRDKPGAIVGPRVWYRHFSIVGTYGGSRVSPNPWVTRTADAHAGQTAAKFQSVLHDELKR